MAKSRFEYVRNFELPDPLLLGTYIIVRIDGRGFHKFSDTHNLDKPNDIRALELMDRAAMSVMEDLGDVVLAFGESDEYSFLIRKSSNLYNRRRSKINSTIVSIFTSSYVFHWSTYFPEMPLRYPPSFDSRVVLYPSAKEVRDYFSWRQADTHINNLQNTSFWALVKEGLSTTEANKVLQGTDSKDKNELLFTRFGINYNNIPPRFRKGSIIIRSDPNAPESSTSTPADPIAGGSSVLVTADSSRQIDHIVSGEEEDESARDSDLTQNVEDRITIETVRSDVVLPSQVVGKKAKRKIKPYEGTMGPLCVLHEDIIRDAFWEKRPWLLT